MNCINCRSKDIKNINFEDICLDCGCVQSCDYIVYQDKSTCNEEIEEAVVGTFETLSDLCIVMQLPDTAYQTTKDLLSDMISDGIIKKINIYICIACLYISQTLIKSTRISFKEYSQNDKKISKYITICRQYVSKKKGKWMTKDQRAGDARSNMFEEYLGKISKNLCSSDNTKIPLLPFRRHSYKLYDSIKENMDDDRFVGMHHKNIYLTLLFLSIMHFDKTYTKKEFCSIADISITTLSKIKGILDSFLCSGLLDSRFTR